MAAALLLTCAVEFSRAGILDTLGAEILRPNQITWSDLDLRPPLAESPIPFALAEVETLLQAPQSSQGTAEKWRRRLLHGAAEKDVVLDSLFIALRPARERGQAWAEAGASLGSGKKGGAYSPSAASLIRESLRTYAGDLRPAEWDSLRAITQDFFVLHAEDTSLDAVGMEKSRLLEKKRSDTLYRWAQRLRPHHLVRAAKEMQALQQALIDSLSILGPRRGMLAAKKKVLAAGLAWHPGGMGPDHHRVSGGVWLDPGGDDTWEITADGKAGGYLILIDWGGRDRYLQSDTSRGAPGFGGVSLIYDREGDDHYLEKHFGFSSGVFGVGLVRDAAGNDVYRGQCAVQGFGFFGLGVLQDKAGDDTYGAALFSQGVGGSSGLGLLWDGGGNDSYEIRPVFVDDLRYRDHFLSMGQGFAMGNMSAEAGGIGILYDAAGHDRYAADIFAQGAAYWHGLGLLLDDAGSDRYFAHQYAQGAGVHEAVGIAWDGSGNDTWVSKGVSQGCGHDRGLGLLAEIEGDDRYSAVDMSQGAGSANGLGMLLDLRGKDAYQAVKPSMCLGHGDLRRDRGSFGFFMDLEGEDVYPSGFVNHGGWRVDGQPKRGHGIGRDR